LIWGDSHLNDATLRASWRCRKPNDRQTRSTLLAARPWDKEPHLASAIARLLFGAATFKSAQQGRDSVRSTVPKKAFRSRASDSCFHPFNLR
jgi:hypothetical protein